MDHERIGRQRSRLIVGGTETVAGRLGALVEATRADELMITTMVYDHAARRHSYELLAQAFGLPRPG
jgi:alkanesulfonate monooxygenase SsuD/methylene tetrahydromethanopterin reductase-like flavin-dependent oxidoreductase (luciferase family)